MKAREFFYDRRLPSSVIVMWHRHNMDENKVLRAYYCRFYYFRFRGFTFRCRMFTCPRKKFNKLIINKLAILGHRHRAC